jgi:SlyX protein
MLSSRNANMNYVITGYTNTGRNMEQQITDLQTRLSFLEDNIDQLNRTVVEQQNQVYELQQLLSQLQKQLQAITPSGIDAELDVKPPHY